MRENANLTITIGMRVPFYASAIIAGLGFIMVIIYVKEPKDLLEADNKKNESKYTELSVMEAAVEDTNLDTKRAEAEVSDTSIISANPENEKDSSTQKVETTPGKCTLDSFSIFKSFWCMFSMFIQLLFLMLIISLHTMIQRL
jgi:hypothetical protein